MKEDRRRIVVFHQVRRFSPARTGWYVKRAGQHWRMKWHGPYATMDEALDVAYMLIPEDVRRNGLPIVDIEV